MSLTKSIRTRFENLLTGVYAENASYSITAGRFTVPSTDTVDVPDYNKTRSCVVTITPPLPLLPLNMCDTNAMFTARMNVEVSYLITNRGNDDSEDETPEGGEFTKTAVSARMATDEYEIIRVFSLADNLTGLTPPVVSCAVAGSNTSFTPTEGKLSIDFTLSMWASLTTNYATI